MSDNNSICNNENPVITFEILTDKIRNSDSDYDLTKITEAFKLADAAHEGAFRKGGDLYISHPLAVAEILVDLRADTNMIVSALLHDVVEDTDIKLSELRKKFGDDVANLVDGLTKLEKIKVEEFGDTEEAREDFLAAKEEEEIENIRKIMLAMTEDYRVMVIKLADRLHNIRTLAPFRDEKRKRIAHETLSFYAPIAHRLGMVRIKDEFENTSLFYLDNYAYKEIEKIVENHVKKHEGFIEEVIARISERLKQDIQPAPIVEGRIKSIYSLYKKIYITGKRIEDVYDLYAVRIITEKPTDCYLISGIIQEIFTPLPNRYKDYIAFPKRNGYKSLHLIVQSKGGMPFEVQIRTREMHATARYGVAAHWRYKLGITPENLPKTKFDSIQDMTKEKPDVTEYENYTQSLRDELSAEQVYVFTPRNKVIKLMAGATVVDFAYTIHTKIGNSMKGAKVHDKDVRFDYKLQNGDVVEIITDDTPGYGPNRSWLDYAKTNLAKAKIRHWLKKNRKETNESSGRAFVESILARNEVKASEWELTLMAKKYGFDEIKPFYEAIGYGAISNKSVSLWISEKLGKKLAKKSKVKSRLPIPIPPLIGRESREPRESKGKQKKTHTAVIKIVAVDHRSLLLDMTKIIAKSDGIITSSNFEITDSGNALLEFTVDIDSDKLQAALMKIDKTSGVMSVERTI